jgi:hypothetical protein
MMNTLFCLFPMLSSLLVAAAQTASQNLRADWKQLPGDVDAGESTGVPGKASKGWFTLAADCAGEILMRKNHAEYPVASARPAFSDHDLMIAFCDKGATKASHEDGENYAIHYDVSFSPDKKEIIFLGEKGAAGPRYRLTYEDMKSGTVKVLFEIAPPDKPGKFAKYVEATVHGKR